MRYRPAPSVTPLRTFSISAGLAASTRDAREHGAGRIFDDAGDGRLRPRGRLHGEQARQHDTYTYDTHASVNSPLSCSRAQAAPADST